MESPTSAMSPAKAYHFLTHAVAPRPIAWVTSLHGDVVNVAPFSWFQAVCADPPMVMVAVVDDAQREGGLKDTARNVQATGEFTVNIARGGQLRDLVATSADLPPDRSEANEVGLRLEPATAVAPPRVAGCAAWLECRLHETRRYGRDTAPTTLLVGEVVHVAAADDVLTDRGVVDAVKAGLPARLGGIEYLTVERTFRVARP